MFMSSATICLLSVPYMCVSSIRESYIDSVANLDVRICKRRHTAPWRVGILYLSHNLLQLSKPFIVMSRRSVVLYTT